MPRLLKGDVREDASPGMVTIVYLFMPFHKEGKRISDDAMLSTWSGLLFYLSLCHPAHLERVGCCFHEQAGGRTWAYIPESLDSIKGSQQPGGGEGHRTYYLNEDIWHGDSMGPV